jgi:hypothetical protein
MMELDRQALLSLVSLGSAIVEKGANPKVVVTEALRRSEAMMMSLGTAMASVRDDISEYPESRGLWK